jgi:GTPase
MELQENYVMYENISKLLNDKLEIIYDISKDNKDIFESLCNKLNYNIILLDEGNDELSYLVRRNDIKDMNLKIALSGSVDSGKSTIIGVLSNGELDNGRGHARSKVFQFKHELDVGKTSSVNQYIMGYDSQGSLTNDKYINRKRDDWDTIIKNSSKIITLYDLAGHEKYLKTTIFGLTGNQPDYVIILVGSNMGVTRITKEHMSLCIALNIPFIIVLTKIDICPAHIYTNTLNTIKKLLRLPGVKRIPYIIKQQDDIINYIKNINNQTKLNNRITPILSVSNVTGESINLLKLMLNLIPINYTTNTNVRYYINDTFVVKGVGTVVSGLLKTGNVNIGDNVLLGPYSDGKFKKTQIKSIHCKKRLVETVNGCKNACFSLRKINRNEIKKGMVILKESDNIDIKSYWYFEAEIYILNTHSTTVTTKYEPVVHINNIRESVYITSIIDPITNEDIVNISNGRKVKMIMKFKFKPCFLEKGDKIIIRDNRTKAIGIVLGVLPT